MRMQETRIIKALPISTHPEFEATKNSIMEELAKLIAEYKQVGTPINSPKRKAIDDLLDRLVDNPYQVSAGPFDHDDDSDAEETPLPTVSTQLDYSTASMGNRENSLLCNALVSVPSNPDRPVPTLHAPWSAAWEIYVLKECPSIIAKAIATRSHTIPPYDRPFLHLNCFPDIAEHPKKHRSYADWSHATYIQIHASMMTVHDAVLMTEEQTRAIKHWSAPLSSIISSPEAPITAALASSNPNPSSILPPQLQSISTEAKPAEIPKWQLKRDLVKRERLQNPHMGNKAPKTWALCEEEHRLITEQALKIQAQNTRYAFIAEQEQLRKASENERIKNEKRLAQEHRDRVFKADPSKSNLLVPPVCVSLPQTRIALASIDENSTKGPRIIFREKGKKKNRCLTKNTIASMAGKKVGEEAEEEAWEDDDDNTLREALGNVEDMVKTGVKTQVVTVNDLNTVTQGVDQSMETSASSKNIHPSSKAIPIIGSMGANCAVDDDGDENTWNPKWIVEQRKPMQYSAGGTRMHIR
jgi:hypothetical protein